MKIKLGNNLIYIAIIIALSIAFVLTQLNSCNKDKKIKELKKRNERNLKAMTDTVTKIDSFTFSEKIPEFTKSQITSSPYYKQLKSKVQTYISELNNKEEIIAATKFKLTKKDSIIDSLKYKNKLLSSTDSTLTFTKGTKFKWKDTTKSLTLKQQVILNKHLKRSLDYTISISPNVVFSRTDDGIVKGTYKFKDKNIKIEGKGSFVVPKTYTNNTKIEVSLTPDIGYLIKNKSFSAGGGITIEHGKYNHSIRYTYPDQKISYSIGIRIFKSK